MSFFSGLISYAVTHRFWMPLVAVLVIVAGTMAIRNTNMDVFPDLTAPTITVITETGNLSPEETELSVTLPLELSLSSVQGIRRTRSVSTTGLSIVWAEFSWSTSPREARQVIAEKLQSASSVLPEGVRSPVISPETGIMSEVLTVGLLSDRHDPVTLRETAQREVVRTLQQIPGVAQVFVSGGDIGQWHVEIDPAGCIAHDISWDEVVQALSVAGENTSAGIRVENARESVVRVMGRIDDAHELENLVVGMRSGIAITLRQVARVRPGHALRRGTASINGKPGIVITVLKQPEENTLRLETRMRRELAGMQKRLPEGMTLVPDLFNQAVFIRTAVSNVTQSLRDGAILVVLVLLLFMMNFKAAFISLTSLPFSLWIAVILMNRWGVEFNTMSLGGLTLAIGVLVDDAIIGVENTWRHLGEPEALHKKVSRVVREATLEIMPSVVSANILIAMVFIPVFFIGGMEGRLIAPLGFAYIAANVASLFVSFTLTPALGALLFRHRKAEQEQDNRLLRILKGLYTPVLNLSMRHPRWLVFLLVCMIPGTLYLLTRLDQRFLPDWNEGALNITILAETGTSLEQSDALAREVELQLLQVPEVVSTSRRTGRTELDEHAMESSGSEMEVALRRTGRSRAAMLSEIRERVSRVSGVRVQVGQPLSHRIDHMLSGVRSSIAVKIVGDDLHDLRRAAHQVAAILESEPGVVDVVVEPQVYVHQWHIVLDSEALGIAGLQREPLANLVEMALYGKTTGQLLTRFGLVRDVRVTVQKGGESLESDFGALRIHSPVFGWIPLDTVASLQSSMGPNAVLHENGHRRMLVTAESAKRDTVGLVKKLQQRVDAMTLPPGMHVVWGGQFQSQQRSTRTLFWAAWIIAGCIGTILWMTFKSFSRMLLMILNLPFAMVGGVLSLQLTDTALSVASLLGFITLFGISVRNGILLITQFDHLEKTTDWPMETCVRVGALVRLSPILMTALTSVLALVPLVFRSELPGNEIQAPIAIVMLGGIGSSMLLSLLVIPTLFLWTKLRHPERSTNVR